MTKPLLNMFFIKKKQHLFAMKGESTDFIVIQI